ncbi:MAG: beta-lactamase family protein [Ignavibacteriales bacterium]|nr:beta-lactamase family protein [Ignavibacteriales bacterium]
MRKIINSIFYLALFLTINLVAQHKLDDYGALFIQAINSASEAEQREIISRIFSQSAINEVGIDRLLGLVKQLHDSYAPIVYHHSETLTFNKPEGMSYIMHIYAKKDGDVMWQDFQMRLDPEPPNKLKTIGFIAEVSEPIALPNGSIEQKETLDWLNGYIQTLNSKYDLYGSILIARGNNILFEKYFGFADKEKTSPINSNSLFGMASGGKMFTALCIAKLVEDKKLNYNDHITKYIDGFSDKTKADKITIHNLLTHTSGVEHYWWGQKSEAYSNAVTINDHLKMVLDVGFKSDAGKEYEYNNSNYILLGAIIEKVSRTDYFTFVKENILDKAGMSNSGYFNNETNNTVSPLVRSEKGDSWIEVERVKGKGSSAGGSYSNVNDMLKFSNALKNNLIVSRETFKNMISIKNNNMVATEDYGYGFIIGKSAREISYGHGGTAKGVNFEFRYFPNSDITFVIFSNQDNGAYDDLKRNTIKLITGER